MRKRIKRNSVAVCFVSLAHHICNLLHTRCRCDHENCALCLGPTNRRERHNVVSKPVVELEVGWEASKKPHRVRRGDPRFFQVTRVNQCSLVSFGLGIPRRGECLCERPCPWNRAGHVKVNPLLDLRLLTGSQVLLFMPLDCALTGLINDPASHANHQQDNRSDDQALTHRGSVRDGKATAQ